MLYIGICYNRSVNFGVAHCCYLWGILSRLCLVVLLIFQFFCVVFFFPRSNVSITLGVLCVMKRAFFLKLIIMLIGVFLYLLPSFNDKSSGFYDISPRGIISEIRLSTSLKFL